MCLGKKPKAPKAPANVAANAATPPVPTFLGAADAAAAANPLFALPSTILSGAEFDYAKQQNAKRAVAIGNAQWADKDALAKANKAKDDAAKAAQEAGIKAASKTKWGKIALDMTADKGQ